MLQKFDHVNEVNEVKRGLIALSKLKRPPERS